MCFDITTILAFSLGLLLGLVLLIATVAIMDRRLVKTK